MISITLGWATVAAIVIIVTFLYVLLTALLVSLVETTLQGINSRISFIGAFITELSALIILVFLGSKVLPLLVAYLVPA